jgi:AbiV family abortive infection protein
VIQLDPARAALLAEFRRGGELVLDNAEQLYREACILRGNAALSRALALHQLSNEECAKVEMLGASAMAVVLGHEVDLRKLERAFRDHESKNHVNAYFASTTEEERAARTQGDWAAASKAFGALKDKLHQLFNTNKNAALYVAFENGVFSAPKDVVTETVVQEVAALNSYLLGIAAASVRLLRRVEINEWGFQEVPAVFLERLEELSTQMPNDLEQALDMAIKEMLARARTPQSE